MAWSFSVHGPLLSRFDPASARERLLAFAPTGALSELRQKMTAQRVDQSTDERSAGASVTLVRLRRGPGSP